MHIMYEGLLTVKFHNRLCLHLLMLTQEEIDFTQTPDYFNWILITLDRASELAPHLINYT